MVLDIMNFPFFGHCNFQSNFSDALNFFLRISRRYEFFPSNIIIEVLKKDTETLNKNFVTF